MLDFVGLRVELGGGQKRRAGHVFFNFQYRRAQHCRCFRAVSDFVVARFVHAKNGVASKKVGIESDRPSLVKKVFELAIRTISNMAFGGQGEGLTFVCAVGVARRGLRQNGLAEKQAEQHLEQCPIALNG